MDEEQGFRGAIRDNPADALARMAYADWLQDGGRDRDATLQRVLAEPGEDRHRLDYATACDAEATAIQSGATAMLASGELVAQQSDGKWKGGNALRQRAEFIRVQVEMAKLPQRVTLERPGVVPLYAIPVAVKDVPNIKAAVARRDELARRERELWDGGVATTILNESAPMHGVHLDRVREEMLVSCVGKPVRGFIAHVTGPAADWLEQGDAICEAHPVQRVKFTDPVPHDDVRFPFAPRRREGTSEFAFTPRWPGIEFEMPLFVNADWSTPTNASPVADLRAWRDRLAGAGRGVLPSSAAD